MKLFGLKVRLCLGAFIYSALALNTAIADDTEVFFANNSQNNGRIKPNVLFVFDTSGSMSNSVRIEDEDGNSVNASKMSIVQDVMTDVLARLDGIKMGMGRFSVPGGPILYPVKDPDEQMSPSIVRAVISGNDDGVESNNQVSLSDFYLDDGSLSDGDIIAVRFQNVGVPQGAVIENARVIFGADSDSLLDTGYEIYVEQTPNASELVESAKNFSNRISGTAVKWVPEAWDAEPIIDPENDGPTTFETPNIKDALQSVINLKGGDFTDTAGWCGGNDLVVLFKKVGDAPRKALAYEQSPDFAPRLKVDFSADIPDGMNGCYENTIVKTVGSGQDDTVMYSDGTFSYGPGSWYTMISPQLKSTVLTFRDLLIPQGSVITSASLSVISASTRTSGNKVSSIYTYRGTSIADNDNWNIHNSSSVYGPVSWSIGAWEFGVPYDTPQVEDIVQPLVSSGGWVSGESDIAFVLTYDSNSSNRVFYSYEGSAARAATLEIKYIGRYEPSSSTRRSGMVNTVIDFKSNGNTPISDTYAEAIKYFKGEEVLYGLQRGSPEKRDNRVSHFESMVEGTGSIVTPPGCTESNPSATVCKDEKIVSVGSNKPTYDSPIEDACQSNHIVLITDGEPTSHDTQTSDLYEAWVQQLYQARGETIPDGEVSCADNDNGKDCTEKLAGLIHANDALPSTSGDERITTHTIGFYSSQDFLQRVANKGGGIYATAYSKDALEKAITEILESILDVNTTFTSAGVTVNQYNRLTHSDQMYFSLFGPSSKTVWPGNLKRYRLLDGKVVDQNNTAAVNPLTGKFRTTAQSFWSTDIDGDEVSLGGAASKLTNSRNVYSNLSGDVNADLTGTSNVISASNPSVTTTLLNATDDAEKNKIVKWALGQNVNDASDPTAARYEMGDPLHSQPTLIIYKDTTATSGYRTSVYVGTNEGYLHSIDSDTGSENWGFIPRDLMGRLKEVMNETAGNHTYGVDGSVSVLIVEDDTTGTPGVVEADLGEKAYIYFGMRRGGTSYYALDVTDPAKPILKFKITPSSLGITGSRQLGETWSQPVLRKMKFNTNEHVMIFGGGYSTVQDTEGTATQNDTEGRNVFIVDAFTGSLLWSVDDAEDVSSTTSAGSLSTMNAIPDQITAFDIDDDGYVDHFYAADTRAQIFRFDVDFANTKPIRGGRIAHLQNVADADNNRRFYNTPDVALIQSDQGAFMSIAIGSGYRAHPLDETVNDHFYMIMDKGVLSEEFDMDAGLSDLADVTDLVGDTDGDGQSDALEAIQDPTSPKKGWYIRFTRSGEKVITSSVTFNNLIYFTTYEPPDLTGVTCEAKAGNSRLYLMKAVDASPVIDTNSDSLINQDDRAMDLQIPGIAPPPQILLESTSGGVKARVCVGNQCELPAPDDDNKVKPFRWRVN
ncbi:pilus assembly protein [Aliikangiella sp. G2MR2-5]|uniref:pilus assembly protein n=1 Tax=Aliikangiella sp. G2MR2-5 TaxID=2788943 RepID=UPI0018A8FDED|nr:PilC/PilY family type IV pilus protein [Aliikangiella sp. G2MR2-5]